MRYSKVQQIRTGREGGLKMRRAYAAPLLTILHSWATWPKSTYLCQLQLEVDEQKLAHLAIVAVADAADEELELLFVRSGRHLDWRSVRLKVLEYGRGLKCCGVSSRSLERWLRLTGWWIFGMKEVQKIYVWDWMNFRQRWENVSF